MQTKRSKLGQYYTSEDIGRLIVKFLRAPKRPKIVEISAGEGALLQAIVNKWGNSKITTAEIDTENTKKLRKLYSGLHMKGDALDGKLYSRHNVKNENFDIAICNPPYVKYPLTKNILELLKKIGIRAFVTNTGSISSDVLFFAKNLELLKPEGEMAIILPDTFFTGSNYLDLRSWLLRHHRVKIVIQLPNSVFKDADAKTHVLIIKKGNQYGNKIRLAKANKNGEILKEVYISKDEAIQRMDYDFHAWQIKIRKFDNKKWKTLEEIGASIVRGRDQQIFFKKNKLECIHTTNFDGVKQKKGLRKKKTKSTRKQMINAEMGDILIPRVGKQCLGKAMLITRGKKPITDVVYRIRVKKSLRAKVWRSLTSEYGITWRENHAHGVCARFLTLADIKKFPVYMG